MAMYPDRDSDYMMIEPGSIAPDRITSVVRTIMHRTWAPQTIRDQAPINYREWTEQPATLKRRMVTASSACPRIYR
jgi:hypothetical protein